MLWNTKLKCKLYELLSEEHITRQETKIFRKAIDRMTPKKMEVIGENRNGLELVYKCPECGAEFNRFYNKKKACIECGQLIKWEE